MKLILIQTVILIEDGEAGPPERRPPVDHLLDFLETLRRVNRKPGRDMKRIEEARHGAHVSQ